MQAGDGGDAAIAAVAHDHSAFARLLGLRVVSAARDRVVAQITVTPDLLNRNGMLHGGAIMAFADSMGGTATFLNLTPDQTTTTVESKTNFFRPVAVGQVLQAETVALHLGRKTHVWQTRLTRDDGKLAALVTQTQMVLPRSRD